MNLFDFFSFSSLAHNERRQADAALCTKNERPKNGADAKPCLSDVYKNGTRARRRQADVPFFGRSMVEMLGVLAIIGVLSVGAISGYSKAMFKYKLNKHAEQMNTLINAVSRYSHSFSKDFRNTFLTSYFIKLGEVPVEMVRTGSVNTIYDVFGNAWGIYYIYNNNNESLNLISNISSLTTDSEQGLEICRNLLLTAKENSGNIVYVSTLSGYQTDEQKQGNIYGDAYCTSGRSCFKSLTLDQIYSICTKHIGTKSAEFKIVWKV